MPPPGDPENADFLETRQTYKAIKLGHVNVPGSLKAWVPKFWRRKRAAPFPWGPALQGRQGYPPRRLGAAGESILAKGVIGAGESVLVVRFLGEVPVAVLAQGTL